MDVIQLTIEKIDLLVKDLDRIMHAESMQDPDWSGVDLWESTAVNLLKEMGAGQIAEHLTNADSSYPSPDPYGQFSRHVEGKRAVLLAFKKQLETYSEHWTKKLSNSGALAKPLNPPVEKQKSDKEAPKSISNKVFVVHGRNEKARDAMFQFLRSIKLEPQEWPKLVKATGKASPYIGEVLDNAIGKVQAVVVLMTPDDEGRCFEQFHLKGDESFEKDLTPQARQNVLFEAGMAMGRHPEKTILVQIGQIRPFSDIGGRYIIKFDGSTAKRQELAQQLEKAGCPTDLEGVEWHRVGDFSLPETISSSTKSAEMKFKPPFWYAEQDSVPHCPNCWEAEEKAIHLTGPVDVVAGPRYDCPHCKRLYVSPRRHKHERLERDQAEPLY